MIDQMKFVLIVISHEINREVIIMCRPFSLEDTCSLHQKKVYTCDIGMYSKARGTIGKVGQLNGVCGTTPTFHLPPPSVLRSQLDKSVYFLLEATVWLIIQTHFHLYNNCYC